MKKKEKKREGGREGGRMSNGRWESGWEGGKANTFNRVNIFVSIHSKQLHVLSILSFSLVSNFRSFSKH